MSPQLPSMAKRTDMVGLQHSVSPIEQATAIRKVGAAEHNWNARYPQRVLFAYTADSYWRKRDGFGSDQPEMVAVLVRNWTKELRGGLIRGLWAWSGAKLTDRIVMRLDRSSHRPRGSLRSLHNEMTGNDRN
jgi:nuclear transport factor 2 (NTF2) superfamily protein